MFNLLLLYAQNTSKIKKKNFITLYNNNNKKRQKHISFFHILKKNTSKIVSVLQIEIEFWSIILLNN